jgi:hypothetical protein
VDPLKELLAEKRDTLKNLKVKLKELEKEKINHATQAQLQEEIKYLEGYIRRFKPSNMEPVKVGQIVINYKLYKDFIKKLKGYRVITQLDDARLIIRYSNRQVHGELKLLDISSHFPPGSKFREVKINA